MSRIIRIGTRSSELALWQADTVSNQLKYLGHETEIVKIDSIGDEVLNKPLYELGTTGVFTKNLDTALLNDRIDIAVHSLKDVPTVLPNGIVQAAVLKRGLHHDILALKDNEDFFTKKTAIIATGSLRRKAQWLHRFPHHKITDLRGNVNTRMRKLKENDWNGAIFAMAGLKRIGILPNNILKLDWMIPAPAQGAVMVAALEKDNDLLNILAELNDKETELCVGIEREFLNKLEGGCSAPIGALAMIKDEELKFKGALFSTDGKQKIEFSKTVPVNHTTDIAQFAATYILDKGGRKLMRKEGEVEKEINIFSTKHLSIGQKSTLNQRIGADMSDFITIRHNRIKNNVVKQPIKHVIITSQNAVEAISDNFMASELNFEHIYCVGRRTKRLIERNIGKVTHVENSASNLANYLAEQIKNEEATYFCGNHRRDELPDLLNKNGVTLNEITAYQTLLSPNKLLKKYDGLLFFSPSGIESFLSKNSVDQQVAFCIGATTAKEARKHFTSVVEAKLPSVESVLNSVNAYFIK
ncbi:MAG: hydroxymethylbilane synthase [Flavobacteriales bacterium]|nr:hydroxymethylbilane synthase [Flavobacteriales bacterium]